MTEAATTKKVCHLIGNGPSKQFFQNPDADDVYGCNFGEEGLDMKAVFIHDRRPLMCLLRTKKKFEKYPVIVRTNYVRLAQQCIKAGLIPASNFATLPARIREKTSGHDGLVFLLYFAPEKYDEIHLWGFDSLLTGIVDSDSKAKIQGSNPQIRRLPVWLKRFHAIFDDLKKRGEKTVFLHHDDIFSDVMTD